MRNSNLVKIILGAQGEQRSSILLHIEDRMRAAFHCEPPTTHGAICAGIIDKKIMATLVIQGTMSRAPFSLEDQYDFDPSVSPFPFVREEMVQVTRWTSSRRLASLTLIHACAQLAKDMGKKYMLMEAKYTAVNRLEEIGIYCAEIRTAVLNLEKTLQRVGSGGMEYYTTQPVPKLYMLDIENMISACSVELLTFKDYKS